jgi:hypothetical protein
MQHALSLTPGWPGFTLPGNESSADVRATSHGPRDCTLVQCGYFIHAELGGHQVQRFGELHLGDVATVQ